MNPLAWAAATVVLFGLTYHFYVNIATTVANLMGTGLLIVSFISLAMMVDQAWIDLKSSFGGGSD